MGELTYNYRKELGQLQMQLQYQTARAADLEGQLSNTPSNYGRQQD